MRVGKKAKVVEAKKTRSCVVRLEKVSTPPIQQKKPRTSGVSPRTSSRSEEKSLVRGPIKKRHIIQGRQNTSTSSKTSSPNLIKQTSSKPNTPNQTASSKANTPHSGQKVTSKSSTPHLTQQASTNAKDAKHKPKVIVKTKNIITKPIEPLSTPPTIAAGRSRRAIKPNPKYASEDIVTPKIMRNVAGTPVTTSKKASASTEKYQKQRKPPSISSLDDFFNRDSNDEMGDDDLEDELDRMYREITKDSDSDFSIESKIVETPTNKKRGKGRRGPHAPTSTATTATSVSTPRQTPQPIQKSQTSQLQMLRKSFAAKVNRSIEPIAGVKRKRNESSTIDNSSDNDPDLGGSDRKRFLLTKPSNVGKDSRTAKANDNNMPARKTTQTLNGSKILTKLKQVTIPVAEPKRNIKFIEKPKPRVIERPTARVMEKPIPRVIEKRTLMDGNMLSMKMSQQSKMLQAFRNASNKSGTTSPSSITTLTTSATTPMTTIPTRTLITMPIKTQNARGLTVSKRRSASPAITKPQAKPTVEDKAHQNFENKAEDMLSSTVDDFETMPTFTIVNINDIINKKGDVLISKSAKSQKTSDESEEETDIDVLQTKSKIKDYLSSGTTRRKPLPTNKLVKEAQQRSKSPLTTTTKKTPTQKLINHTIATKTSPQNSGSSVAMRNKLNSSTTSEKPAPRILNSVVAKKTQPVKPMIANFDDSADEENYQLSLDGDEQMADDNEEDKTKNTPLAAEDDDDNNNGNKGHDNEPDHSFEIGKHKPPTSTPYPAKKITPSSVKENSQTALNRQPPKMIEQRKNTPEKVVISRQGDKVIKKITCFETWFVIMPEETTPKVIRNALEIPLIKLANVATYLKLPSDYWKSKVTLHELSPTMLAKTNLTLYTGDLKEYNIAESDRNRYQPSCVMFRRSVSDRVKSRLPYDRAVIFKNRTFFTNIEGKNVKLVGAPSTINSQKDVEILLQIVDSLTLQSSFVEPTNTIQ